MYHVFIHREVEEILEHTWYESKEQLFIWAADNPADLKIAVIVDGKEIGLTPALFDIKEMD